MAVLKLLGEINRDIPDGAIIDTLQKDPSLTYHILRLVNSAALITANKINSVKQALSILGRRRLTRWLQLLLFAVGNDQRPAPLVELAARRGKFMELLVEHWTHRTGTLHDRAYMAGVFSLVDALLGLPMQEVLQHLGLEEEIEDALLRRKGQLGKLLELCERVEAADFDNAQRIAGELSLPYAHVMNS
jgi:EAL and modified HD-GYP domain-containing signal transduction protein